MLGSQDILIVLFALAGKTYLMRASGPLLASRRRYCQRRYWVRWVAVGGFGTGEALVVDARTAGLAAAALARGAG